MHGDLGRDYGSTDVVKESLTKKFLFLDALRESGETNMYGASLYLMTAFGLERNDARDVLGLWMQTFDPNKSAEDRAALAGGPHA